VGLGRSFVLLRQVTVHLGRHPLEEIEESPTFFGYVQRLLASLYNVRLGTAGDDVFAAVDPVWQERE
jgi:hypothetical protein